MDIIRGEEKGEIFIEVGKDVENVEHFGIGVGFCGGGGAWGELGHDGKPQAAAEDGGADAERQRHKEGEAIRFR